MHARALLLLTLALGPACAHGGRVAPAPSSSGPLQARTTYLTHEVDGEAAQARFRAEAADRVAARGGLVLASRADALHLRVPEEAVDELVDEMVELAPIVDRRTVAPEVSGQVHDLRARIASRRALRDRLLALLAKAETVEDVLAIERELGRVTEALAVAEAALAAQESKVAFTDLHVRLVDPATPGPVGWVFYGLYTGVKWLFVWD